MLCACGCGQEAGGYYKRRRFFPARWVRGHNRRGKANPRRDQARDAWHDASCVAVAPIRALVRSRGVTGPALAEMLGLSVRGAQSFLERPRIRRSSAERILRALAGLREPNAEEQEMSAREQVRLDRRRYPRNYPNKGARRQMWTIDEDWVEAGACVGHQEPDLWWPEPPKGRPPTDWGAWEATVQRAKDVCRTCPVQSQCLRWAMENPKQANAGIWGGLTAKERDQARTGNYPLGA